MRFMICQGVQRCLRACFAFIGGFVLGQIYYNYMLRDLLSPYDVSGIVSLVLSVTIGLLNAVAIQIRCISLLTFPMYLGKDGRRVLKVLILTYVVAGPITNMSLNAREVVRVFACSNDLAHNLSRTRDAMIASPLRDTVANMGDQIERAAETLREIQDVTAPIESEVEFVGEILQSLELTRSADDLLEGTRSKGIEQKYNISPQDKEADIYQKEYLMKTEYRCNNLLSQAVLRCRTQMLQVRQTCMVSLPWQVAPAFSAPLMTPVACDVPHILAVDICDSRKQVEPTFCEQRGARVAIATQETRETETADIFSQIEKTDVPLLQIAPGLGIGYAALKRAKTELMTGPDDVTIAHKEPDENETYGDVQAAKETGERVKQAFEEKFSTIQHAITAVNICLALLFLRIAAAAQQYHDLYLTGIDFDNVYITDLFKRIDRRRSKRNQYTLLPLKKMERNRYVDVYSLAYVTADRHRLLTQTLKVLLEVVTATTFVMLDRLFYEALDVVRMHAETEAESGLRDLEIEVEGTGVIADTLRAMLFNLRNSYVEGNATNSCLPKPRSMPAIFYLRIYGGYVWVLLLLCANPYTLRLRRLICSYFYPRREKQRVYHLYNDILKKRIKLDATLRRKAVQAVRAHYLSGESLLMRFPNVLGWLRILPAARMGCLICGEIEPRNNINSGWKACAMPKCPFLYCAECWREVRGRCLACDPSLAELSDQDSLSDEPPVY